MKYLLSIILAAFLLTSCYEKNKYQRGHFPENVVNFKDVNTGYDDYNSAAPFIYDRRLFHFSSNRNSNWHDFDLVGEDMFIDWSKTKGTLQIGTGSTELDPEGIDHRFDYLMPLFDTINTSCNELGPYSIGYNSGAGISEYNLTDLILYANDCSGNYDIRFAYADNPNYDTQPATLHSSREVSFLNTGANELYPTFYGAYFNYFTGSEPDIRKIEKILYCSDKEGKFNIYEVPFNPGTDMIGSLLSTQHVEPVKSVVSSEGDDKCPYINGRLMVFASNRPGGYGGYDLYYSHNKDGAWSAPVNFGAGINSAYDEYRPIALFFYGFDNLLMIFSSNRPGGQGGYDLYYTGISQSIN